MAATRDSSPDRCAAFSGRTEADLSRSWAAGFRRPAQGAAAWRCARREGRACRAAGASGWGALWPQLAASSVRGFAARSGAPWSMDLGLDHCAQSLYAQSQARVAILRAAPRRAGPARYPHRAAASLTVSRHRSRHQASPIARGRARGEARRQLRTVGHKRRAAPLIDSEALPPSDSRSASVFHIHPPQSRAGARRRHRRRGAGCNERTEATGLERQGACLGACVCRTASRAARFAAPPMSWPGGSYANLGRVQPRIGPPPWLPVGDLCRGDGEARAQACRGFFAGTGAISEHAPAPATTIASSNGDRLLWGGRITTDTRARAPPRLREMMRGRHPRGLSPSSARSQSTMPLARHHWATAPPT